MPFGYKHWLTPDWPAPANVHAATTLRTGGASCGAYASLNPAMHVGDDADLVRQNRQTIKAMLDLPSEPVWLEQIHSNRAVQALAAEPLQQADASYTAESGVVCAVLTADCLPLLVCTADGGQVAAIHAGWRGLLAGVIGNTLTAMTSTGVLVWLGPAIGPDCFEVGQEVRDAFLEKSLTFTTAFKQQSNGKWLADIYQLARIDLARLGVDRVYGGGFCTVTEHERFYSYRRDKETGRMATLIWRV
ncbi:peptidoglycan editing factor PgeF [Candidatus Methylobacter oryzae]|uniref:Purine nucleoside phosphorylase n=1 Tax=Candidatus Methylobacter oryzae TaxID=2497749 RepID=A0ABY3C728_9GAMM|nr:peptidoglycan editing factor PgeF [Candidatus Methylobacter oryzae]TRW91439.1 peptidoglycan editing factor PgeF [Candidatus Methylobacter oryzae]